MKTKQLKQKYNIGIAQSKNLEPVIPIACSSSGLSKHADLV